MSTNIPQRVYFILHVSDTSLSNTYLIINPANAQMKKSRRPEWDGGMKCVIYAPK